MSSNDKFNFGMIFVLVFLVSFFVGFVAHDTIDRGMSHRHTTQKQIETVPDNIDGVKFGGYGKMYVEDKYNTGYISFIDKDKEKASLYVEKRNARNFSDDDDTRYKLVKIYYVED